MSEERRVEIIISTSRAGLKKKTGLGVAEHSAALRRCQLTKNSQKLGRRQKLVNYPARKKWFRLTPSDDLQVHSNAALKVENNYREVMKLSERWNVVSRDASFFALRLPLFLFLFSTT